jgi:starch phosphorylase
MNEGHAALLSLALLEEARNGRHGDIVTSQEVDAVRHLCVFTTHTPVSAGHDQFSWELTGDVIGQRRARLLQSLDLPPAGALNMTSLALRFSRYVNAVSMRHGEVSRQMFPGVEVHDITNGMHAGTWASPSFSELFDRYTPGWRRDNGLLKGVESVPLDEVQEAHIRAKRWLFKYVADVTGTALSEDVFTIGFARRATPYKRADLLFTDIERLKRISHEAGGIQVIYAGKAHPRDTGGKEIIRRVFEAAKVLEGDVRVVYLANHSMDIVRDMCAGVDLWLNTPEKPREASGTSGMKAALNGVPSLSTLDGWWVEGHVEGVTGWAIGDASPQNGHREHEAALLYEKLEWLVLPMFYRYPAEYRRVMRNAIAMNGSRFTAQAMLDQYMSEAYLMPAGAAT